MPGSVSDSLPSLPEQMRATGVPELVEKADELSAAIEATFGDEPAPDAIKKMLGAWARARKAWAEYHGKDFWDV